MLIQSILGAVTLENCQLSYYQNQTIIQEGLKGKNLEKKRTERKSRSRSKSKRTKEKRRSS